MYVTVYLCVYIYIHPASDQWVQTDFWLLAVAPSPLKSASCLGFPGCKPGDHQLLWGENQGNPTPQSDVGNICVYNMCIYIYIHVLTWNIGQSADAGNKIFGKNRQIVHISWWEATYVWALPTCVQSQKGTLPMPEQSWKMISLEAGRKTSKTSSAAVSQA